MKKILVLLAAVACSTAAFAQTATPTNHRTAAGTTLAPHRTEAGKVVHGVKKDVAVGVEKTEHGLKDAGHFVGKEAHKVTHVVHHKARVADQKTKNTVQ